MSRILVFGAGGRAGRAAVEESRRRGHQVTAAVRNLDWLVSSPAGEFDAGICTGPVPDRRDFAVALLDEVENPHHHRTHLRIEDG